MTSGITHFQVAGDDSDSSGSDWEESGQDGTFFETKCLFCSKAGLPPEDVFKHCELEHGFNLTLIKRKFGEQY